MDLHFMMGLDSDDVVTLLDLKCLVAAWNIIGIDALMLINLMGTTHSRHLSSVSSHWRLVSSHCLFDLLCTLLPTCSIRVNARVYAGIIAVVDPFETTLVSNVSRGSLLIFLHSLLLTRVESWPWLCIRCTVIFSILIDTISFLTVNYSELFTHLNQILEWFFGPFILSWSYLRLIVVLIFFDHLETF